MEHKTLNELLKVKLGMQVDEFSAVCDTPQTTLRDWFKNPKKQAALLLMIDGVKFRNGWVA